jgi:hypothetical protein
LNGGCEPQWCVDLIAELRDRAEAFKAIEDEPS